MLGAESALVNNGHTEKITTHLLYGAVQHLAYPLKRSNVASAIVDPAQGRAAAITFAKIALGALQNFRPNPQSKQSLFF